VLETTFFGPAIATIVVLAAVSALIARLTGRPAPLVFLLAGLIAGPLTGLVPASETADLFAEYGLVFLLFLIGLDLTIERVKPLLRQTAWISPAQMIVTFLVFAGLGSLFFSTTVAIVIGIAMTYSSTAVVLTMLERRGEADTETGRLNMSILLFEDMTVILIIAGITAGGATSALASAAGQAVLSLIGLLTAAAILTVVLPRLLADSYDQPHAYFIQAIGVLFLFLGLSQTIDISAEIGAFFAGITLAQLPGHKELHERVKPLTTLFMALFFIGLGLQLTRADLLAHADLAVLFAAVILIEKLILHLGLFHLAGFDRETVVRGAINMTQTSEFSLILGTAAVGAGLIGQQILGLLALIALLTMMASTILIDGQDSIYRRIAVDKDQKHHETGALLIGFGDDGAEVLGLLRSHFDTVTVVDPHIETAQALKDADVHHVFASIEHEAVKREAGFHTADIIVALETDAEEGLELLAAGPTDGRLILVTDDTDTAQILRDGGADTVLDRESFRIQAMKDAIKDRGDQDG
jgi:Kef-type K+ transport system membrane component KefB